MPNSCQTRTTHYDLLSLNSTHNSLLSQKLCMPERSDRSGNEMPVLFRAHACLRAKTCAKLVQNACKTRAKLLCTRKLVQNSCKTRAKLVPNSCKIRAKFMLFVPNSCKTRAKLVQNSRQTPLYAQTHAKLVQNACQTCANSCQTRAKLVPHTTTYCH